MKVAVGKVRVLVASADPLVACRVSALVMFDLVFVSIAWEGTHGDAVATVEPLCLNGGLSGVLYVSAEIIVDKISPGKEIAAADTVVS